MRKTTLVLVIGLAVAALAVAGCGGDDDSTATDTDTATETETSGVGEGEELYASVGPGFEISLTTEDGDPITTLTAGTYTIEVKDQSDQHNFHLSGPGGVDQATEVSEVEDVDWEVTLEAGTYNYVCDPHASQMKGSFEVTG